MSCLLLHCSLPMDHQGDHVIAPDVAEALVGFTLGDS